MSHIVAPTVTVFLQKRHGKIEAFIRGDGVPVNISLMDWDAFEASEEGSKTDVLMPNGVTFDREVQDFVFEEGWQMHPLTT